MHAVSYACCSLLLLIQQNNKGIANINKGWETIGKILTHFEHNRLEPSI